MNVTIKNLTLGVKFTEIPIIPVIVHRDKRVVEDSPRGWKGVESW